ncbi:MAG TPA: hypothetical protein VMT61_18835 [Candidatus Binataceae bacterium]|nr:hypothetical protein [Candidatus Binataceae bacterium]
MRLCVGTAKGIVILDPDRGATPLMVSADPPSVWCMAQDCERPNLIYAGSVHNVQAGSARGKSSLAVSDDGGRIWRDITPGSARDEEVWAVAAAPDQPDQVFIGTSHARIFRSDDAGHSFRECAAFQKLPGRDRWTFPQSRVPHVRSLTFDPHNPNIFYVGVEEGGVYCTRDRGKSFEPLSQNIHADIHCVAVDPDDPGRIYATTGRGLYVSTKKSPAWTAIKGLERNYAIPLLLRPNGNGVVYTAGSAGPPATWSLDDRGADALMYRSDESGSTFYVIAANDGMIHPMHGMVMRFIADPEDNQVIYGALSDGGIIRIDEHTYTVSVVSDKLPPAYDIAIVT